MNKIKKVSNKKIDKDTSIRLKQSTVGILNQWKAYKRDTYNDIIVRLFASLRKKDEGE